MLKQTLDHLLSQVDDIQAAKEVLVIDNANDPETANTLAEINRIHHAEVRYEIEPQAGISHARNLAIKESKGVYLLYLDDDCLPLTNWFTAAVSFIENHQGVKWGMVGGKVVNHYLHGRPPWLTNHLSSYYSAIDLGDQPILFSDHSGWIPEGNCIVNKAVLLQTGDYNTSLGHHKKCMLSHEGNDLQTRMMESGYDCYYWPDLVVEHQLFEKERYRKRWLFKRAYWGGFSEGIISAQEENTNIPILSQYKALLHPRTLVGAIPTKQSIDKTCQFLHRLAYLRAYRFVKKQDLSSTK